MVKAIPAWAHVVSVLSTSVVAVVIGIVSRNELALVVLLLAPLQLLTARRSFRLVICASAIALALFVACTAFLLRDQASVAMFARLAAGAAIILIGGVLSARVIRLQTHLEESVQIAAEVSNVTSMQYDAHAMETKKFAEIMEDLNLERRRFAAGERLFRETLNATPIALFMINSKGLIHLVNTQAEHVFGYSRDELLGKPVEILVPDRLRDSHRLSRQIFAASPEHRVMGLNREIFGRRKDGTEIPIEIGLNPIEHNNESFIVSAIVDLTDRKRIEKRLRAKTEEAEKANAAKSEFLATMSHELRTPLNGVIGMTELLAGTTLNKKQKRFLEACRKSGDLLLNLINDILDLSKIESGRLELDIHPFELNELINDTVETLAWQARQKQLAMPREVGPNEETWLEGDSNRLQQVLVNLLGNGIKFTRTGEVGIRVTELAKSDREIRLRFSVYDTGQGIPASKLDRLFKPFSQVDASTTRRHGGTGLGLKISQSLIRLMGGEIQVESKVGEGSSFSFELSFAVPSKSVLPSTQQAEVKPLPRRNLVVHSQDAALDDIVSSFDRIGIELECVFSIGDALERLELAVVDGNPYEAFFVEQAIADRCPIEFQRLCESRTERCILIVDHDDVEITDFDQSTRGLYATLKRPFTTKDLRSLLEAGDVASPSLNANHPSNDSNSAGPSVHALIVEDNEINQLYLVELLTQLGCTCETASTGLEAIEAIKQKPSGFDLVFMDCQMPEMDGFQATREIRRLESTGSNSEATKVIALTANAIKGDEERCLAAGMDGYLAKPVTKEQVAQVIRKFGQNRTTTSSSNCGPSVPSASGHPLDVESLAKRCFHNLDFAESLLDQLEFSAPKRIKAIANSLESHDVKQAAEVAHSLRGAAAILCATSIQELSLQLEESARQEDVSSAKSHFLALQNAVQDCLEVIPETKSLLKLCCDTNQTFQESSQKQL